jgi:hypothetical protein
MTNGDLRLYPGRSISGFRRSDFASQGFSGPSATNVPEPTSVVLLAAGLLDLLGPRRLVTLPSTRH